jgi:hypothetical protein
MINNEGVLAEHCSSCIDCGSEGLIVHSGLRDHLFGARENGKSAAAFGRIVDSRGSIRGRCRPN